MPNLTVELIHPPHPEAIEDRLDVPLGLLYIAASLKQVGYNVRVNDLSGIGVEGWEIKSADIYGITAYAPSMHIVKNIAIKCKEVNPDCVVVIGGAHPTALPEHMDSIYDCVVIGEGELAFLDIIRDYPNCERYYENPLTSDLDQYANPSYHSIDLNSYTRTVEGKKSVSMVTSRGCPFRCAFCGLTKEHRFIKYRSPEAVASEIKYLKYNHGIEAFNFQDDTFTISRQRLYHLLDLIEPLNIVFRCHGRAGLDRKDDYIKLKKAGCVQLSWGIESGSQYILDRMNKQVDVLDNEAVIRWAKEVGITSRAFFVIGFPGETANTIQETKDFIERTNPDQYFVSSFIPYPATDVWLNPEKYGVTWISNNFSDYYQIDKDGFGGIAVETEFLKKEELRELEKDFRTWIGRREKRGPLLDYEILIERKK